MKKIKERKKKVNKITNNQRDREKKKKTREKVMIRRRGGKESGKITAEKSKIQHDLLILAQNYLFKNILYKPFLAHISHISTPLSSYLVPYFHLKRVRNTKEKENTIFLLWNLKSTNQ